MEIGSPLGDAEVIINKSPDQLAREDLIRQTLEAAAVILDNYSTNKFYRKALRVGARLIREHKEKVSEKYPANAP